MVTDRSGWQSSRLLPMRSFPPNLAKVAAALSFISVTSPSASQTVRAKFTPSFQFSILFSVFPAPAPRFSILDSPYIIKYEYAEIPPSRARRGPPQHKEIQEAPRGKGEAGPLPGGGAPGPLRLQCPAL